MEEAPAGEEEGAKEEEDKPKPRQSRAELEAAFWKRQANVVGEKPSRAWAALDVESQNALKAILPPSAAILWQDTDFAPSDYDSANEAPFNRGINVYGKGVPGIFSLLYRRNTA